jgi:hypothetical protein
MLHQQQVPQAAGGAPAALGHELQSLQVGALARRHAGLGQRLRGVQVGLRRGHLRRLGQR